MKTNNNKKCYKNEWKFFCSPFRLDALEYRLKNAFSRDIHSDENAKYVVNSLYFDDCNNTCLNDVEAGNPDRFKYRIRYYNNDLSTLKLERKEKLYGYSRKFETKISKEYAKKIIEKQFVDIFWDTNDKLLKRFLIDFINGNYSPKIITKYERSAFVDDIKNIRITLDRDITSSVDFNNFLSAKCNEYPLNSGNECVWEIKFNQILPQYIKKICFAKFMSRQTFSKYYLACKNIKRITPWI